MRLPKMLREPTAPVDETMPLRSILLWTLVGGAVITGIVLYFRYERTLTPLVG